MNPNKKKSTFRKPELTVEDLSLALYNANIKLTKTNQQLQESEQNRLEMFSNLSHDLRSPITTIQSNVEYLLSLEQLDEQEVITTLNLINSKTLQLDHLMNELLLINTLDTMTKETFDLKPLKIGIFLEDFFYSCEADKKYSKRRMFLDVPHVFPYLVSINPKMMYRVLDNLLINALKYSSNNDNIRLNVSCQQEEIIISITDTGIGISISDLQKIFTRTFMVSESRTPTNNKGCGLGLSIAQSIISKHNGRIWCESTLGKGSTFYISLPRIETNI